MTDEPVVAIIGGSGQLGRGLTLRLAGAGVPLIVGSRNEATAEQAVGQLTEAVPGARVRGLLNVEAVAHAELVVLAVPFAHQSATIASTREALTPRHTVIDAVVPLATAVGGKPTRTLSVWQGSAAEQTRDLVPEGVGVVSALHTVSGELLARPEHDLDEDVRVCGDSREGKRKAIALFERIEGLRGVDCGRLEQARIIEPLTALLIGINIRYKTHAGIRITGLPQITQNA